MGEEKDLDQNEKNSEDEERDHFPTGEPGEVMTGEMVAFRVLLPDGDWLYLEGEVKHHRHGFGFGVQFFDLIEEQQEKLQWLLQIGREAGPDAAVISADLVEE